MTSNDVSGAGGGQSQPSDEALVVPTQALESEGGLPRADETPVRSDQTHTITGTSSPPYRYVWTLAPSGATPPLSELVDAYAYVRVHVKNLDTGVAQLLTVTLAITRYNT